VGIETKNTLRMRQKDVSVSHTI